MSLENHNWLTAPKNLALPADEVHIWRFNLERSPSELEYLATTLSEDEVKRGSRFYFDSHRNNFIAGRGILRIILANYLNVNPRQVKFNYEPKGKPVLADTFVCSKLSFNLSHSQGMALCAVTNVRLIGVDLEYMRDISDIEALAQRFFSPKEYNLINSLPDSQKRKTFFRYWTCKEAYLKATGAGLAQLEKVEIILNKNELAKIVTDEKWSLWELAPADNFAGAVAVLGSDLDIKFWDY